MQGKFDLGDIGSQTETLGLFHALVPHFMVAFQAALHSFTTSKQWKRQYNRL